MPVLDSIAGGKIGQGLEKGRIAGEWVETIFLNQEEVREIMTPNHPQKSIKNWPESERPRERMLRQGAKALSDAELVAILIRHGSKGKDAIALSRELIAGFGGLRGLLSVEGRQLQSVKGLGAAKASALLAAAELARRRLREEIEGKDYVRDPESVVQYLYGVLSDLKKEVFKILYLDKGNRILQDRDLFEGTVDEAAVYIREIIKSALDCHATAIIAVHNHPSGRVQPSPEDKEMTQRLMQACRTVSIKLLDHLIIGNRQYFSFAEHHLL